MAGSTENDGHEAAVMHSGNLVHRWEVESVQTVPTNKTGGDSL